MKKQRGGFTCIIVRTWLYAYYLCTNFYFVMFKNLTI